MQYFPFLQNCMYFCPEIKQKNMMENSPKSKSNEIQVELTDDVAQGTYANLAIIAHSASEFILDFIQIVPGAPKAKVKSRIILTPDNAKRLFYALQDNLRKFEEQQQDGGNTNIDSFDNLIPPIGKPGQA